MRYILALLFLTGCVTVDDSKLDLAGRFEKVVFYEESLFSDDRSGREITLLRFETDTVRLRLANADVDPKKHRDKLEAAVRKIQAPLETVLALTGLDAKGAPITKKEDYADVQDGDLVIILATREWARQGVVEDFGYTWYRKQWLRKVATRENPSSFCYVLLAELEGGGSIGVVVLPIDVSEENFDVCAAQELTQAFGAINDLSNVSDTVFSSFNNSTELSESDKRIMKILYDPRLKKGMTRQEAMPIVRQIIAENGW